MFVIILLCSTFAENEINLDDYSFQQSVLLRQQIDEELTAIATNVDFSDYTMDSFLYVSNGKEIRINSVIGNPTELIIPSEIALFYMTLQAVFTGQGICLSEIPLHLRLRRFFYDGNWPCFVL